MQYLNSSATFKKNRSFFYFNYNNDNDMNLCGETLTRQVGTAIFKTLPIRYRYANVTDTLLACIP